MAKGGVVSGIAKAQVYAEDPERLTNKEIPTALCWPVAILCDLWAKKFYGEFIVRLQGWSRPILEVRQVLKNPGDKPWRGCVCSCHWREAELLAEIERLKELVGEATKRGGQ